MIAITISNRQKTLPIDRRRLRRTVSAILRDAEVSEAQIGIAVVDDAAIAKLHDEFMGDPDPTDVLSFLLDDSDGRLEGEIMVSADTALSVAPRYKATADEELARYVIHGALHLVGYDDTTPRKRAIMRKQERKYLTQYGG